MLDYILSKLVLLIFLVLLLSAFGVVKEALNGYFIQQAAKNLVDNIGMHLYKLVTTVNSTTETQSILLPAYIKGGSAAMPYKLYAFTFPQNESCVVAFAVTSQAERQNPRFLAMKTITIPKSKVTIYCTDIKNGNVCLVTTPGAEQKTFLNIIRTLKPNGSISVNICASTGNAGSCTGTKKISCSS